MMDILGILGTLVLVAVFSAWYICERNLRKQNEKESGF